MAVSPVRYKVFEGAGKLDPKTVLMVPQWYIHIILGNNEIVVNGEGLDEERSAHASVESLWLAHAKVFLKDHMVGDAGDRADILAVYPVPYTKDSLKPRKRTPEQAFISTFKSHFPEMASALDDALKQPPAKKAAAKKKPAKRK